MGKKLSKGPEAVEFVGDVQIVLVKSAPTRIGTGLILLTQMMIAATVMTILFFSFSYEMKNIFLSLHVSLSTFGYQFCMPLAILTLNDQNGAATAMTIKDKKKQHAYVNLLGSALGIAATAVVILHKPLDFLKLSVHGYTGLVPVGLSVLNFFTGLLISGCFRKTEGTERVPKCYKALSGFHRFMGSIIFLMASICFILGILKPVVVKWMRMPEIKIILLVFCIFYTVIVLFKPLMKTCGGNKRVNK